MYICVSVRQNAVTLYGNASTDDKGIVSYEWTKAPGSEDRAVDMQVTAAAGQTAAHQTTRTGLSICR